MGKELEIKEHETWVIREEKIQNAIYWHRENLYLSSVQWKYPRQVGNHQAQDGANNSPIANHQGGQREHRKKQNI